MSSPLVLLITRLPAVLSVLSPWESCALSIIENERPTTISFFCKSADQCPNSNFYRMINIPSQTIFTLQIENLPNFGDSDLVFLAFHEDESVWNNEIIEKYRIGGKNDFKVILIVSMNKNSFLSMEGLFENMWKSGVLRSGVILKNETTSQVYTYIPYKRGGVCRDTSPVYLGECSTAYRSVFDVTHKIFDLNKCPIRLSFVDDIPWIMEKPFSGKISHMVLELASRLNFSIETMAPLRDRIGGVCGPEEYTGSKGNLVDGKADVALGVFTTRECSTLHYIGLPHMINLLWCTPVMSERNYIFFFLLELYQPRVWAAVIVTVLLVLFIISTLRYVQNEPMNINAISLASGIFAVVPLKFPTFSERIFVTSWLFFCLVLRTVYEAELKSKSAVPLGNHIIADLEELAEIDIKLCTTIANFQAFEDVDDTLTQTLMSKTKICKGGLYERLESAARNKNGAVLSSDLRCEVTESHIRKRNEARLLYALSGYYAQTMQFIPMVTLPGFPFNKVFHVILQRSYESGLVKKWVISSRPHLRNVAGVRRLPLKNMLPPLFILFIGCVIGFLTLLIENTYSRWSRINLETRGGKYFSAELKTHFHTIAFHRSAKS